MSKTKTRFSEIDVWRATALIAMIIYHFFSIMHFGEVINLPYNNPNLGIQILELTGWFARLSFIFLVGTAAFFSFSRNHQANRFLRTWLHFCKRGLVVLIGASLITLGSYILIPNAYIIFGVLHFIGVILFLLPPIIYNRIITTIVLITSLLINYIPTIQPDLPPIIGIPLGLKPVPYTIDYFAILKWLPLVLFGYLITSIIYHQGTRPQIITKLISKFSILTNQKLSWLGKKTFILYFIHIIAILLLTGLIKYTLQGNIL